MNNYKIFEGYDHFNGKPLYKVVGATTETEDYIGEWHTNKSDAERELSSLNLKMAKGGEVDPINFNEFTLPELEAYVRVKGEGDIQFTISKGNNINSDATFTKKIPNKSLVKSVFSIGELGKQIDIYKGSENIYADVVVYDQNNEIYTISLYSKENQRGLKDIVNSIIEKYAKGGNIRSKAALAKDRKYTSDEPHELRYRFERKSKVMRYDTKMESGGETSKRYHILGQHLKHGTVTHSTTDDFSKIAELVEKANEDFEMLSGGKSYKVFVVDTVTDDDVFNYAIGGGVGEEFYEGQSIMLDDKLPHFRRMTKDIQRLVRPYYNKELVIEEIINDKPYNFAKAFVRSSGEKVPFEIKLNKKIIQQYAKGGQVNPLTLTRAEKARLNALQKKEDANSLTKAENIEYENLVMKYRKTKDYKYYAKGGEVNPEIETKKASLAKIMKVRDGANSSEMAKAQAVKVIEKLEKEIAELEASNVSPVASAEKTKKAADSDKSKTDVSPLESIFIEWHEGTGEFDGKTVKTWSELQRMLTSIYNNSSGGGYTKVKVVFKWKNGKSITDRIDVGSGGGDFNPTTEKIGDYLKKQNGVMYESNLQVGERPMLSWEDSASKPQRKAAAKKKPTPKAPEKKIKDIDLAVAKSVEPKGGVAKRVAATVAKPKFKVGDVVMFEDGTLEMKIDSFKKGYKGAFIYSGHFVSKPSEKFVEAEKDLVLAKKPKRTKKVITSTKRKKAAATETPKRKKKVITSAKRKKAAMREVPDTTKRGLAADKKREALPVGKRVSKGGANQFGKSSGGNTYYEYRRNRADRNAKRKFAEGGNVGTEFAEITAKRFDTEKEAQDWIKKKGDTKNSYRIDKVQYDWGTDYRVIEKYERRKMASGGEVDNYVVTNGEMFLSNRGGRFMLTDNVEMAYTYSKKEAEQQVKHAESLSKDNSKFKVESFRMYNKYAKGGEVDSIKVGMKVGLLNPRNGRYKYSMIEKIEGENVFLVEKHPTRSQWDNHWTTTKSKIQRFLNENNEDFKSKKSYVLKMANGGEVDLTRGEIEDKIAGLRLNIAKTKKQISSYERGKYNKLFQEKVVPLQEEMARLSELYGKSIY
jgi:hypothetical protein